MLEFANDALANTFQVSTHSVVYYLFQSENPEMETSVPESAVQKKGACFSGCLGALNGHYNRVAYLPDLNRSKVLTTQEQERWIEFAKGCKLLPDYIRPERLKSTFVFDFSDMPPSLLYIYLSAVRHLEEFPDSVRIAMLLADKGVDPYLAFCAGERIGCTTVNHNFTGIGPYYGGGGEAGSASFQIRVALALKWYLENPKKYDSRKCGIGEGYCYRSTSTIVGILHYIAASPVVAIKNLDDPRLKDIMATNSIPEAQKALEKFAA